MYKEGLLNRVYSTNLTYIPKEVCNAEWFKKVDMSEFMAEVIDALNHDKSMSPFMDATKNIKRLLEE